MESLSGLSDSQLIAQTKSLVSGERKINLEVLHHLKEIEFRRLFLKYGYSSLFKYAVAELNYSEDAAYRRIQAMRLLKDVPQIEEKIESGSLSLTHASKIQNYFTREKIKKREVDAESKMTLIESLENKSNQEVEKELVALNPKLEVRESIRPVSYDKMELRTPVPTAFIRN